MRKGTDDDVMFSILPAECVCVCECMGSPEAPEEPEGPPVGSVSGFR